METEATEREGRGGDGGEASDNVVRGDWILAITGKERAA